MKNDQLVFFDARFLETYAGTYVLNDPITAIVELVANSWDAGAKKVDIVWPDQEAVKTFEIVDDGSGMTEKEFKKRWRTLSYNRLEEQGPYAEFPADTSLPPRKAFGKNGVGRFAAFCFGGNYIVETSKDGKGVAYRVSRGNETPVKLEKLRSFNTSLHGTKITVENPRFHMMPATQAKAEIGMRFLIDPSFIVNVSGQRIAFRHIPKTNVETHEININGVGKVIIRIIDLQDTDRTTKQHGIAWHVNNRLVGECSWKGTEHEAFLDGRRVEAKRYTFIVIADCLKEMVLKDWTGFDVKSETFIKVNQEVQKFISDKLLSLTKEKRDETYKTVKSALKTEFNSMPLKSREKWAKFVSEAQEKCPSIGEQDLIKLAGVLANLELAENRFKLLHVLHELNPNQLDNLHQLLKDWSVDYAKIVLDELEIRLKLLDELKIKVFDKGTYEVQELQPLFQQGLWIFGPEYETIEFTSNEGMTTVIHNLFNKDLKGSRNRPDFAILPDSSVGFYSYPSYHPLTGEELGIAKVTIVELKKPGISISTDEKAQCWRYVKELYDKGLLQAHSQINCFVLGSDIDTNETHPRIEKDGKVTIQPLNYSLIVDRAKSRLLKLYDRVKAAPFLKQEVLANATEKDPDLFSVV